jgi:hypothetical protein
VEDAGLMVDGSHPTPLLYSIPVPFNAETFVNVVSDAIPKFSAMALFGAVLYGGDG